MQDCHLLDEGVQTLCGALATLGQLTSLDVASNSLTDASLAALLDTLTSACGLSGENQVKQVDVCANSVSFEQVSHFQRVLPLVNLYNTCLDRPRNCCPALCVGPCQLTYGCTDASRFVAV